MNVLEGISGLRSLPAGVAITIGNYDGVHIGHQAIVRRLREVAGGGPVAVVTFEPHPLTVLRPELAPPRLTTSESKQRLLRSLGVDHLVILPPGPEVLGLTAEAFWAILRDDVKPSHIVEGPVFNFGKGRGGTVERLCEWAASTPIRMHVEPSAECVLHDRSVVNISSSLIRWLLGQGRVADAARCLGRPYELRGSVVRGFQRGRTIGVPTANLDVGDQMIPADGVYAAEADVDGTTYAVALSIGNAPTFQKQRYQVEAHLIDFAGDLYDQQLVLRVTGWVRDQAKFPSIELLKEQIARDLNEVRNAAVGRICATPIL
jgi:riboflavin kinase/FMN adenylyltransferase